jgi:hemolysin III
MGLRDPFCCTSHFLVAVWAGFALLLLLKRTGASPSRRLAAAVFGSSMVFLYLTSSLFHGLPFTAAHNRSEFRFFQRLDQSAIYILIAGTNTPVQTTLLDGRWRKWCLIGMWTLAGIGVTCLWLLPKAPHAVIVANCLAMGWLGLLPVRRYYRAVGWRAMNWIWAGCALYTIGAICELMEWPVISESPVRIGFHETFHVITAAASVAFFFFILRFVVPYQRPAREDRCETRAVSAQGRRTIPCRVAMRI